MLQQTQVETALPYYERFISQFPTVKALAAAEEQQVLTLWAGLGLLQPREESHGRGAPRSSPNIGGRIPSDYDALLALPGIGQYMAGAILSIAFNKPYPVVDGNVRRVLSRVYGWTDENPKALWDAAPSWFNAPSRDLVNQALMELGAKICSFRAPRCLLCPIQSSCIAFKTGMQAEIPKVRKRPETIRLHLFAVVQGRNGRYLMKSSKGLWEFPTFNALPAGYFTLVGECRHIITHHRMDISVYTGVSFGRHRL